MYLALIDNNLKEKEVQTFLRHVRERRQWRVAELDPASPEAIEAVLDNSLKPDAILIDVATTTEQEHQLSGKFGKKDRPITQAEQYGGIPLCRKISSEHPTIPIILLTRFDIPHLIREAFRSGARSYLLKTMDTEALAAAVDSVVREAFAHDFAFFEMALKLFADSSGAYDCDVVSKACKDFYQCRDSFRRFQLLCARLKPCLMRVCSNPEKLQDIIRTMCHSHALTSIASPKTRDHVRHSGNVFWMGYYLLNAFSELRRLPTRKYFQAGLWLPDARMPIFDQANLVWMLASLFHDCGYTIEKRSNVEKLLRSVWPTLTKTSDVLPPIAPEQVQKDFAPLLQYLNANPPYGIIVSGVLNWAVNSLGKRLGITRSDTEEFWDHGVLSAWLLLQLAEEQSLDPDLSKLYYHAACAMALHNLAEWDSKYKVKQCSIELPIEVLPICNLLALCDTVQTWDRELDHLIHSDLEIGVKAIEGLTRSMIIGSQLTEFDWIEVNQPRRFVGSIGLRYLLQDGNSKDEVCSELESGINGWIASGRAGNVGRRFLLSEMFDITVRYEIPRRPSVTARLAGD